MKFKFVTTEIDDSDIENIKIDTVTYHFLRNLNTEKMYKDDTDHEFNMQIGELVARMSEAEANPADKNALSELTSLDFLDTRHEVLKYMYADEKNGKLVQNEATRDEFEELELDEAQVFRTFLSKILGS